MRHSFCPLTAMTSTTLAASTPSPRRPAAPSPQVAAPLDVVLVNGRVVDPETNLDAIRAVGIKNGRIASVTTVVPAGRDTVDVRGLVVAPGFIDLHAHGQDSVNYEFFAHDGVTTALELELGTYPVAPWYAKRQGRALINYGVSAGHPGARRAMLDRDSTLEGKEVTSADGAFVRSPIEQEVLADAAATGAPLHVVHVTTMGLGATPVLLDLIEGARARGLDVTTEAYPYTAGATYLQSAMFDPGFQERLGISYNDILWPATGERLTAASVASYRKQGGLAVIFMIPDSAADQAYRRRDVIVASDGGFDIEDGRPSRRGVSRPSTPISAERADCKQAATRISSCSTRNA